MTTPQIRPVRPARQGGVSLIEALVALLVMSLGMLALVGVQSTLRANNDLSRQRAEAARIASEQIEQLRYFNTLLPVAGQPNPSWSEIAAASTASYSLPGATNNTTYTVTRKVSTAASPDRLVVQVDVGWRDRQDAQQVVYLDTVIAAVEPSLAALMMAPPTTPAFARRTGRNPTVPVNARDLGDGTSAFKPPGGDGVAWVFNNTTGRLTSVCTGVSAGQDSLTAALIADASCTASTALLVSGTVRFNLRGALKDLGNGSSAYKPIDAGTTAWVISNTSQRVIQVCTGVSTTVATSDLTASSLLGCTDVSGLVTSPTSGASTYDATDSENPVWPALNLDIGTPDITAMRTRGVLDGTSPVCYDNAPGSALAASLQSEVNYYCLIYASTAGWGGQLNVVPARFADSGSTAWVIGSTAQYKVCRYTTDTPTTNDTNADRTANTDHPKFYCLVTDSARADSACVATRVKTNLANQNFLVIPAGKTCPTDTAVSAADNNLVNSNTRLHQP